MDISTAEIRMISIVGLLVTAVVTILLTTAMVAGGEALGRLIRQPGDRDRVAAALGTANGHREGAPPRSVSDAGARRPREMRS